MFILEVLNSLKAAGAERFVVDISNELVKREDVNVTVVTLMTPSSDEIFRDELSPDIETISLNKKIGFSIKTFFDLCKVIYKKKPDVVHAHTAGINYLLLAILLFPKVKFFMTIHSDANFETTSKFLKWLRKIYLYLRPNIAVTISLQSKESFTNVYGKDSTLIYNGAPSYVLKEYIDISVYKQTPDTKVFINVARIMPVKRQLLIANVFNRLITEGHDVAVIFLGDEKDKDISLKLKSFSNKRFFVLGQKSNPRDYLVYADCFMLASEYEGLPITLIEALSVGCIPICTPVGGCVNVIDDGVNGFLSENLTEESFYCAIKEFLSCSPDTIDKMKKKCISTYVEKYSMKICADKYYELFLR